MRDSSTSFPSSLPGALSKMNETITPASLHQTKVDIVDKYEEKHVEDQDEILPAMDEARHELDASAHDAKRLAWRRKLVEQYGRRAEEEGIAPASDITAVLDVIVDLPIEDALTIALTAIETHQDDLNFPSWTMDKLKLLVQGYKQAQMEASDWEFELRCEAAIIRYHSPYPEVRAVTDPFDDPTQPVETIRAYVLGFALMAGSTALNTFFSPRQPGISISGLVLQCILAPLGQLAAKVLPDWGLTLWGIRHTLNPGEWTFKEQIFASIIIRIGNGAGETYYTYLVQMLPQFLGQEWVTFGYELLLAFYAQFAGFGFAGLLRRFVVYPSVCIWPSVLPTLALNRVLVNTTGRMEETVNGWTMSRYKFFMIAFGAMFVWFWIPNTLFTALHFNWMTWIAPENLTLAMITGFYGGMGFNPWATFDWNVAGTGSLVKPFWAEFQAIWAALATGAITLIGFYANYYYGAYIPMTSNETFDNKGKKYNLSRVMGDDGYINVEAYKEYGPPFYSVSNVLGMGKLPTWYAVTMTYVFIRFWPLIKDAWGQMWNSFRGRAEKVPEDPHMEMMKQYKEAPDWWYLALLLVSLACGIAAVSAWPTHTPWWSLLGMMAVAIVILIPVMFIQAIAQVSASLDIIFKIFCGLWFPGNPMALIILEAVGPAFDHQTESMIGQQKLAHYAKIPPRAVFRGVVLSTFINCMIFIGMLNWMVNNFNAGGTLCTWDNPQHFVCAIAVQDFSSAVMFGAFGVKNMWTLYPIIPYCFLIGGFIGTTFAIGQRYLPGAIEKWRRRSDPDRFDKWHRPIIKYLGWLYRLNPSVVISGMCSGFTGGHNLSYQINGVYVSFIFMYHIKRRYPAWWEKYNYLLEAGFDIGTAVSATVQTLTFSFSGKKIPQWWGNEVSTAGIDYRAYNQKASLIPLPKKGYFGPDPADYPLKYPKSLLDGSKGVRT